MKPEDIKTVVLLRMNEAEEALSDARLLLAQSKGTRTIVNRSFTPRSMRYSHFYRQWARHLGNTKAL